MGTRADFYAGRGLHAEWLGSIAFDGYPDGLDHRDHQPTGRAVLAATTEQEFRNAVAAHLATRDDATFPTEPWPWPWKDSQTTDYAYAVDEGAVWGSCFGSAWFRIDLDADRYGEPWETAETDRKAAIFPDMSERRGSLDYVMGRSGMITVTAPADGGPATVSSGTEGYRDQ